MATVMVVAVMAGYILSNFGPITQNSGDTERHSLRSDTNLSHDGWEGAVTAGSGFELLGSCRGCCSSGGGLAHKSILGFFFCFLEDDDAASLDTLLSTQSLSSRCTRFIESSISIYSSILTCDGALSNRPYGKTGNGENTQ